MKTKSNNQRKKARTESELVITRLFDAPHELVWKAWTEPERMMLWWRPIGFTSPVCKIDFRVGGVCLYCMRSPDGKDYWSTGVYREIVPMEKIVCTDSFADEKGNVVSASYYGMNLDWPLELIVTVIFVEQEGKTKFTLHHSGFPSDADADMAKQGWSTSFDKLAEELAKTRNAKEIEKKHHNLIKAEKNSKELTIIYTFDSPRELVFKVYTDPSLVPQWWGPRRFTTVVEKMDVKPGGVWRYIQHDLEGSEHAFNGIYREVVPPERLVYTFNFEAMPGHESIESGMFEEHKGKTKLIAKAEFQSVEDRDGIINSGMKEGVIETQERLNDLLRKIQKNQHNY